MSSTVVAGATSSYSAKKPGLYAGYAQWHADLPNPTPILEEPGQAMTLQILDTAKSELTRLLNIAPGLFKKKFGDTSLLDFCASFSNEPVDEVGTEAIVDEDEEEDVEESLLEEEVKVWYGWKKGVDYEDVNELPVEGVHSDVKTIVAQKGVVVTAVVHKDANSNVCGGWKMEQENW